MREVNLHRNIDIKYPVITTGTFDGLHLGHQKVLSETIRIAKKYNGTPAVLTFWPHPRHVLGKGEFSILNTFDEKKRLFTDLGIEHVYYQPFTLDFAQLTSDEYVQKILVDKLNIKVLVVGYDHQFGKERTGKFETLGDLAKIFNFKLERVEAFDINGLNVSSTKIRNALQNGNVDDANNMLGYDYFISGKVVEGNKIGRKLGFPTANIELSDPLKMLPADGIYAVYSKISGVIYRGMLSIGFRPTFSDQPRIRTTEVNLFDFDRDIYNENISVYFIKKLRNEIKFANQEELKMQMANDKVSSRNILKDQPRFLSRLM